MGSMPWQPLDAVHADPLATVIPFLRATLDPVRVSTSLVGWRRPDPIVQLHRVGGGFKVVDDEVECQVDVRADDYDSCQTLTALTRRALLLTPITCLLRDAVEERGPEWTKDEDGKPRVRMEWLFVVRPEGA